MVYKEIIRILNDIEQHVPVGSMEYQGMKVWPLIRLDIWKFLHSEISAKETISGTNDKGNKLVLKFTGLFHRTKTYLEGILSKKNVYKKADAVFLIGRAERRAQVEGGYYSPYSNSAEEIFSETGHTTAILDLGRKFMPVHGKTLFIDKEKAALKLDRMRTDKKIKGWDMLEKYLKAHYPQASANISEKSVVKNAESVLGYQNIFERILRKIDPKVCFLVCWYHPTTMGYIRAARKLGIRTVDVQHGEQHGMYRGWANIPAGGYDIMPQQWWCWGAESATEINNWSTKVHPEHKAFVGGNPWISRFLKGKSATRTDQIGNDSVNILVALPGRDMDISNIIGAFKASPANMHWHFRLHPRRLKDGSKEKLAETLKQTGNHNFEIEKASTAVLFDLLLKMDFLITTWSTVAYEALALGVHPIITSGDDKEVFEQYVKKGLFSFADTAETILAVIKKPKASFNFTEEHPYMETDREKMKRLMLDLVKR